MPDQKISQLTELTGLTAAGEQRNALRHLTQSINDGATRPQSYITLSGLVAISQVNSHGPE
jgi:hypothetical protein